MKGIYRRLSKRWGKRTAVLLLAGIGVALLLGGGAVYARLGGSLRPSTASDIELQKGLAGWWKMDGNLHDSSPFRWSTGMRFTHTPLFASDRKGRANSSQQLNGSNDCDTVSGNLFSGSSDFTLSLWANNSVLNDGVPHSIMGDYNSNGPEPPGIAMYMTVGGYLRVYLYDSSGTPETFDVANYFTTQNQWMHIMIAKSGTTVNVYRNGSLFYTTTVASSSLYTTNAYYLGCIGSYWSGSLDDMRVYRRGLSAAEAKALYDQYGPSVQAASGEKGLVGWWKMDGNAKDSSPYRNNGTVTGATLTTDRKGRSGSAYNFSGSNNYISTTTNGLPYPADTHTVSAWIYPTGTDGPITQLTNRSTGGTATLELAGDNLRVHGNGSLIKVSSTTSVTLNQWHHVAYSYAGDGNTGSSHAYCIYLDGQQLACNNSYADGADGGTLQFNIGNYFDHSQFFPGKIDDVRIYNRVLSAAEIAAQYNSYNSQINLRSNPTNSVTGGNINQGLVGYWNFNGNAKDSTPYRNNGTITSATLTTDRFGSTSSAYSFNGSTSAISIQNQTSLQLIGDMTVSAWVNVANNTNYNPIMSKNTDSEYEIGADLRAGNANSLAWRSTVSGTTANISDYFTGYVGTWVHVVVVVSGTSATAYRNGVAVGTMSVGTRSASTNDVTIGRRTSSSYYFGGSIDSVRLYNRALSQAEVTALYQSRD